MNDEQKKNKALAKAIVGQQQFSKLVYWCNFIVIASAAYYFQEPILAFIETLLS